ncbi:MAG: Ig-like domain-containing protein, partial [Stackebrandtia sp.]
MAGAAATTNADTVEFVATFDESVAPVAAGDFDVSGTATSTGLSVSGTGSTHTVTVTGVAGDGSLRVDFDDDGSVTDAAGNAVTPAQHIGDQSYTIDNTDPAITLTPVGTPTSDNTPSLTGSAGIAAGDATSVTVTVYGGSDTTGPEVQTLTAPVASGAYSVDASSLTDGIYTAQATQTDSAGNTGVSLASTFTIDVTDPNVALTAVASPTGDTTPTFTGSAGTAASDAAKVTVTVYDGPD